jgi:outer membrane protein assembly factor BamB
MAKPQESSTVLGLPTSVWPTFRADQDGTYVVELTVTAGADVASDIVTIIATGGGPFEADARLPDAAQVPDAPPCEIPSFASRAVTYQIDPGHTGAQPNGRLSLPLRPRWSRDLGAPPSYSLVADGRVFVIADMGYMVPVAPAVYALDEQSGDILWGPVYLGGGFGFGAAAYDDGRVYAINGSGTLFALDEVTGDQAWSRRLPEQYAFESAPSTSCGRVFVFGAGRGTTLYAVDEKSGTLLWSRDVPLGSDPCSPAASANGVYVAGDINRAFGFDPATGSHLWGNTWFGDGRGQNVALFGGAIYTRDPVFPTGLILDATDGSDRGSYESKFLPAFSPSRMIVTPRGRTAGGSGGRWSRDVDLRQRRVSCRGAARRWIARRRGHKQRA